MLKSKKASFIFNPVILKLAVVLILAFGAMFIGKFINSHISMISSSIAGWTIFIVTFILVAKVGLI
jgi:hypothetical protein